MMGGCDGGQTIGGGPSAQRRIARFPRALLQGLACCQSKAQDLVADAKLITNAGDISGFIGALAPKAMVYSRYDKTTRHGRMCEQQKAKTVRST